MANFLEQLIYKTESPQFMTTVTPEMLKRLTPKQLETVSAIQTANQALVSSGLSDVSDFMTNLAMQESRLGKDISDVSYSPFQIDPIRYRDIQSKAMAGEGQTLKRASMANKLLESMGYGDNFDILDLSNEERRDPNIGALLTRMMLANIPKSIPKDLTGQSHYWKDYWNTTAGQGKPSDFINQVQYYNSFLNTKTYDNTVLE